MNTTIDRQCWVIEEIPTRLGIMNMFISGDDGNLIYFQTKESKMYNEKNYVISISFKWYINSGPIGFKGYSLTEVVDDITTWENINYIATQKECKDIRFIIVEDFEKYVGDNMSAYLLKKQEEYMRIKMNNELFDLLKERKNINSKISQIKFRLRAYMKCEEEL